MSDPSVPGVLFVCEGNICRSPVAELILAADGTGGSSFPIASAGLRAVPGQPIEERMAFHLSRMGIEPDHGAVRATRGMLQAAGLVLTMTRDQRGRVVELAPVRTRTTFTLRELAQIAAHIPREVADGPDDHRLFAWVCEHRGAVVAGTDPMSLDVADPLGRGRRAARTSFELIRDAVRDIQALVPRLLAGQP